MNELYFSAKFVSRHFLVPGRIARATTVILEKVIGVANSSLPIFKRELDNPFPSFLKLINFHPYMRQGGNLPSSG